MVTPPPPRVRTSFPRSKLMRCQTNGRAEQQLHLLLCNADTFLFDLEYCVGTCTIAMWCGVPVADAPTCLGGCLHAVSGMGQRPPVQATPPVALDRSLRLRGASSVTEQNRWFHHIFSASERRVWGRWVVAHGHLKRVEVGLEGGTMTAVHMTCTE